MWIKGWIFVIVWWLVEIISILIFLGWIWDRGDGVYEFGKVVGYEGFCKLFKEFGFYFVFNGKLLGGDRIRIEF